MLTDPPRHGANGAGSRKSEGFALVAAIWLAGLIAVIATDFIAKVRLEALTAANAAHAIQAEYMADGMARLLAWRLAKGTEMKADGTVQACQWPGGPVVEFAVQDQAGLADLNTMPPAFFMMLFEAAGEAKAAVKLGNALADFRDADSIGQLGGNESEGYAASSWGPKNAPFEAVEELDQLPGMTDGLYRRLLPLVTVHSAQPGIDPETAPLALRKLFSEPDSGPFAGKLAPFTGAPQARAFGIDTRVALQSGARFQRKAIIVVIQQPDRPYVTVTWMRGPDWEGEIPRQKTVTPCFN